MTAIRLLSSILLAASLAATGAEGANVELAAWRLEEGTDPPSYAAVEPRTTNLNIDMVVLACEETGDNRVLQLQLYLTDDGPLRPKGPGSHPSKDNPRAEISIDGRTFPTALLFADDYVVLADAQHGLFPRLSDRLLAAMQTGKKMTLRFDLLAERPGQPSSFDGEAVIDLQSGGGHQAIAALRRCATPTDDRRIGLASSHNPAL